MKFVEIWEMYNFMRVESGTRAGRTLFREVCLTEWWGGAACASESNRSTVFGLLKKRRKSYRTLKIQDFV